MSESITVEAIVPARVCRRLAQFLVQCRYRVQIVARLEVSMVPSSVTAHNLPLHLTSFIGREREIAEVRRLLAMTRLLTLTGLGGCGKTPLALQVAATGSSDHADGVHFASLAPIPHPGLALSTIAHAPGVRGQGLSQSVAQARARARA